MGYGIAMVVMAVTAQAAGPADKAAGLERLDSARRLLQNGRYAEAEEAYATAEAEAKKRPGGVMPPLKLAVGLGKAECQASQGEYGKAIEGLKALAAEQPMEPEVAAR